MFTVRQLLQTLRMGFQGLFLMGAFCAAMEVKPQLQPHEDRVAKFQCTGKGMRIEARYEYLLVDITITLTLPIEIYHLPTQEAQNPLCGMCPLLLKPERLLQLWDITARASHSMIRLYCG